RPRGTGLDNLLLIPEALWKGVVPSEHASHDDAARIGLLTIGLLVLWKPLAPRKLKVIPAPLVAGTIVTAGTVFPQLPIKQVAVPDRLLDAVQLPVWDGLDRLAEWRALLVAGAALAFIASAETLLSAAAVDQMRPGGPRTRYDAELAAQGVGN